MKIEKARVENAARILDVQKTAFLSQAKIYNDYALLPLTETLEELIADFQLKTIYTASFDGIIVGSVRSFLAEGTCHIGRLAVLPTYRRRGVGTGLLQKIEEDFCGSTRFELFTGSKSLNNIRLYEKLGYKIYRTEKYKEDANMLYLEKYAKH